jgi:hypothetical protein
MTVTFVKQYSSFAGNKFRRYETDDNRTIDVKVLDKTTGETISNDEAKATAERHLVVKAT